MQKKKKKRAQTTAVKQVTKILHACDVDKGIESVIEGKKTVLKLSDFNLVHLKLVPKLHLYGMPYLLKSECLEYDAVDKFKQFESILICFLRQIPIKI